MLREQVNPNQSKFTNFDLRQTPDQPEQRLEFDDGLHAFSQYSSSILKLSEPSSRIESSSTGRYIYTSGEFVSRIDRLDSSLASNRIYKNKAFMIKSLQAGEVVYNEVDTFDLVFLDADNLERGRIKGAGGEPLTYFKSVYCRSSNDDRFFVWMNGKLSVSVVDCQYLKVRTLPDFWKPTSEANLYVEPVAVIASADGSVVVGVSEAPNGQFIHVCDERTGLTIFEAGSILKRGRPM